ncbi:MAG TPA: aldehyde dehydrogenase family protein [Candidatus Baltobacteraceae bacterium]|nr:aldehyde dehydrogenase family protein [Candidatus Baltobacteraceae bacterium]
MQDLARPVERDLETLGAAKTAWAGLSIELKIALLHTLKRNVYNVAHEWTAAACEAKGLDLNSPLAGEEWISGPWAVLYAIERYIRTLDEIDEYGTPRLRAVREREGRTVVEVFPNDLYDRLLLTGLRAEVWMQPGVTPEQTRERAGSFYRKPHAGRVALVLGAGNISSIAPLDVLYKLIAGGCVCMVKMNPVNAYLQPIFERAFEPFVQAGFVRFASGGAETGAYLCGHRAIDEIHVTGSEATHRAIVREAPGKTITSELGNVSPTIVVPGSWSAADIRYQAEHIATQKAHNAGFNCIASQVAIVRKGWEHAAALRAEVQNVLRAMEPRPEYYPGAAQRRAELAGEHAQMRTIVDVGADDYAPLFEREAFCGVLAWLELPCEEHDFLDEAVRFANERLSGTLGANIIVHPKTARAHPADLKRAIAGLRYGCVGVNAWTGTGYFICETPWGAYPGHTLRSPGSGIGVVHNARLLEDTEKSVVYAPFRTFPKPAWFVTNENAGAIGRALCTFEMERSPGAFLRVAAQALKG